MVNFKTFFAEALGKYPKSATQGGVEAALREPLTPGEQQKISTERGRIGRYKQKRGDIYPDGKYNFQLVDGFKAMLANAWRALRKPGQSDSNAYSVLVLGDPGIGKSDIIRSTAKKLSEAENKMAPSKSPDGTPVERKYVEWARLQPDEKTEVMENPEKYYVFMDLRVAYLTTAGLEGLPVPESDQLSKSQFYKALPPQFVAFITNPDAAGLLFLDEVNQASREVQAVLYQIINDRIFKDSAVAPRILILGAANLGIDITLPMGSALSTRFVGAVLVPDPDAWFDWATEKGINPIIIDYVRTDPDGAESTFFKYPTEEGQGARQWPNPRAITRFSVQFNNLYEEYERLKATDPEQARKFQFREKVSAEAKGGCGPEWGEGFEQYLKQHTDIDLEKLAGDVENYQKLPAVTKHQASTKLIQQILQDIDDSITSDSKTVEVGTPPLKTYPYDENVLKTNLAKLTIPLMTNNPVDANIKILKGLKAREPDYLLIFLDGLVKDEKAYEILSAIEISLPNKNEQI